MQASRTSVHDVEEEANQSTHAGNAGEEQLHVYVAVANE